MTELRRGRIRERWVIVAPERAKRPVAHEEAGRDIAAPEAGDCPFCAGREELTPPEIYRIPGPGDTWRVRVIPNKFPAFECCDEEGPDARDRLFERLDGCGAHEVVIDTPEHAMQLPDLAEDHVKAILDTFAVRLRALMGDPMHRYVLVYKNHGREAGASLSHSHSQIVAMPIIPEGVQRMLNTAKVYYERQRRCLFCDVLREELREGRRVVEEREGYVTLTPFDSRLPFELAIYPQEHAHDFASIGGEQRRRLARVLKCALQRLRTLLDDVPYTLVLQTAPNMTRRPGKPHYWSTLAHDYHWRLEILPRTTTLGGLEWGTGLHINTVSPEDAAQALRNTAVSSWWRHGNESKEWIGGAHADPHLAREGQEGLGSGGFQMPRMAP